MARPRTPKAKAKVTGQDKVRRKKFEARTEVKVSEGVGDPPEWLLDSEHNKPREAWTILRREVPWLNSSHRMLMATVCNQLGRLIAGQEIGVQASVFIKQCLSEMGATPSAASKAGAKPDGDKNEDPAAKYFT
ncbi:hypothetical protein LB523_12120 [Mesorhizobium sp. ESP-6-4]|uniref:hypothetical protein n=1 Tax=Mesorhizobium sp. ESP-6-4 TaxID=2876624 RepID=UPI001CCD1C6D|nr:hypothetical protein [Mesorhizobium sp. ESP-6-4]MBZ9659792.1 hypothetical protein [Mesorhizobium sp. ESP-6-4]